MKFSLYIIAILLVIGWTVGFIVYSVGAIIHLLLVIAGISILVAVFNVNTKPSRRVTRVAKT